MQPLSGITSARYDSYSFPAKQSEEAADVSGNKSKGEADLQLTKLSAEELKEVEKLQQRDREVKAHELAHKAAAGQYVRGGKFSYTTGPDGRRYAVGGDVSIDASRESDPEQTLEKANLIRRAALAPATPSAQDYRVAAQASAMAAEARAEIAAAKHQQQEAQVKEQDGEKPVIGALQKHAIEAFSSVANFSLHSNPDPFDDLV